jgi:purine-binding chemotaxis protein CheW
MKYFATFTLDIDKDIDVAIAVESITRTTPVSDALQPLPGSVDFLEGVMHLNGALLPVVNLKKRLGLPSSSWSATSKVAVITVFNQPCGILFDDIKEVLRVEDDAVIPIHAALQSSDPIFSHIIKPKGRTGHFNLLDLGALFQQDAMAISGFQASEPSVPRPCEPFIVFSCDGQRYGIPVENSRELTFLSEIDETFKNNVFIGAIHLRRETIPILETHRLLLGQSVAGPLPDEGKILVLSAHEMLAGIVVDEVLELVRLYNDEILPMPEESKGNTRGIYPCQDKPDIMLLDIPSLLAPHKRELSSVAHLTEQEATAETIGRPGSQHLITENGYLVFSIGKKFAVELRYIQEIIDNHAVMPTPDSRGYRRGVINLRGRVVPVISLRHFYSFPEDENAMDEKKLIICTSNGQYLALEVDSIITISKQEKSYAAPSLRRELADKQDTLDRLINFALETEKAQHALAVNIPILIKNHLAISGE